MVYDEIIIINKWELNNNVKIGIINRGELEMKNLNYVNVIDNENVSDNVNYNNENRISEEREYKYNENEYKEDKNNKIISYNLYDYYFAFFICNMKYIYFSTCIICFI